MEGFLWRRLLFLLCIWYLKNKQKQSGEAVMRFTRYILGPVSDRLFYYT